MATEAYAGKGQLEKLKMILATSTVIPTPTTPPRDSPEFIESPGGEAYEPDRLWIDLEEGPISKSVYPAHPSHTAGE